MDKDDAEQAKGMLLAGVGWAFKAAPHPLLKAAVALLGVAGHLQLTLAVKKEKEVKGERVKVVDVP